MRATPVLLLVSLFGVLFLTSCGGNVQANVYDAQSRKVGEVQYESGDTSTIVSVHGETRGRVRGTLIRDEQGGRAGSIEQRDGHTVILDTDGNAVGSLEKNTDCYGKSQTLLGRVSAEITPEAAGAACLLLLLPKE